MAKILDKRKEIREKGATKVLVASYWVRYPKYRSLYKCNF